MAITTTFHNRAAKLIRIDRDIKATLTHQAVCKGMNLNTYIEYLLKEAAETEEDRVLSMLMDEGDQTPLTGEEEVEFKHYMKSFKTK